MTVTETERIQISSQTVRDAQTMPLLHDATLLLRADGAEVELPENVQELLFRALSAIATNKAVAIGQIPDELTSNTAADLLGVSRPTLLKWAKQGRIASFKVGSHTRFHLDDVQQFLRQRDQDQAAAFAELLALDAEHPELFEE